MNRLLPRAGGYGEHQCVGVASRGKTIQTDRPYFKVKLEPGCGGTLEIRIQRYVNQPALAFPWERVIAH